MACSFGFKAPFVDPGGAPVRSLKNKVIVLTGASAGIGRATAIALAREGAVLHLVARRAQLLREVCEEVQRLGGVATSHALDITDAEALTRLAKQVYAEHGRVDVLINNAGRGVTKMFLETTDDDWRWTFEGNVHAVVAGIRAFLPIMLEGGERTIVNVASIAGVTGNILSAYTASKFAVVGLSESLLQEYGDRGVNVIVVCPGIIKTDMAQAAIDAGRTNETLGVKLRQAAEQHGAPPEVVARAIVRAIRRPRFLVFTPIHANIMRIIYRLFPAGWRKIARRLT